MKKIIDGHYKTIDFEKLDKIIDGLIDKLSIRNFEGKIEPVHLNTKYAKKCWRDDKKKEEKGFGKLLIEHGNGNAILNYSIELCDSDQSYKDKRYITIKANCKKQTITLSASEAYPNRIIDDGLEKVRQAIEFNSFKEKLDFFIVHGHDKGKKKNDVKEFIETYFKVTPTILKEQPYATETIIKNLENYSDVGFAIVLFTPDDCGFPKKKVLKIKKRARQNVIFELGYFMGKFGRNRVCILNSGEIEIPSDIDGILRIDMDENWQKKLVQEIAHANIIDPQTKMQILQKLTKQEEKDDDSTDEISS